MVQREWLRRGLIVTALCSVSLGCSQAPRRGGASNTGGDGSDEETGGAGGKAGGTGGKTGGGATGGRSGGNGGPTGGNSGTQADASVSAPAKGDAAAAVTDLAPDLPYSPIPGFAICVVCHGPEGAGTVNGPEIQHPVIDFSTWVIRNGRMHPMYKELMPKFVSAVLPDDQLQGIFAFLAKPPKPTTGEGLYKDYCQNCHGADAKGGVTMRPIDAQPMTSYTSHCRAGTHLGDFGNRREYMPKWTATELTDAELRLIFMYVSGL